MKNTQYLSSNQMQSIQTLIFSINLKYLHITIFMQKIQLKNLVRELIFFEESYFMC